MKKRISKYILAVLVFIIPFYIYFNPPTDSDGGPMLAHNFLFFYPLLLLSSIIALILLIIGINNFKINRIENSLLISSTFPTILLLTLVLINFINISNENQYEESIEKKKSTEVVKINDKLSINLDGYTFKQKRKKVTFKPNKENQNIYTNGQFIQGKYDSFFFFYKVNSDSLDIFIPKNEPLYFTNDSLKKLPIRVHFINKSDTVMLKKKEIINRFDWK